MAYWLFNQGMIARCWRTWATWRSKPEKFEEPGRLQKAAKLCIKRDRKHCLVTRATGPLEIAQICPTSFILQEHDNGQVDFWVVDSWVSFGVFSEEEGVNLWSGPAGADTCANMMTLCPHFHDLWKRGQFGLEPVEVNEEGTKLTVVFHWLPQDGRAWCSSQSMLTSPDLPKESRPQATDIMQCWDMQTMRSGTRLICTTENLSTHPLPSVRLLAMRWNLSCLLLLSGVTTAKLSDIYSGYNPATGDESTDEDDNDYASVYDETDGYESD